MTESPGTLESLDALARAAREELGRAEDASALERWRIAYLGRKGRLKTVLRTLGELDPAERRRVGQEANRLKEELERAFGEKKAELDRLRIESVQ